MTSEPKTCGTCHHWQRDPGCDHMGVCWRTCFRDDYGSEVYAEIGDYYKACAIHEPRGDSLERVALDALRVINDAAEDMHGAGMFSEAQAAWMSYRGLKARLSELGVGE